MRTNADPADRSIGQWLALILAIAFTIVGVAGFFVTGFDDFTGDTGEMLLGLEVNGLHNLVHLVLGLVGLGMWRTEMGARAYGWLTLVGYGLVAIYGFSMMEGEELLSLNTTDNVVHVVFALGGLATALLASRHMGTAGYGRPAGRHA